MNIRSGPSTNHDILGTISSSQYIFATAKPSNGWVKFYKGYLSENYLLKVNSNDNYKVNTDGLNFRVGPGTSYNIVSTLTYGNQIVYYSRILGIQIGLLLIKVIVVLPILQVLKILQLQRLLLPLLQKVLVISLQNFVELY